MLVGAAAVLLTATGCSVPQGPVLVCKHQRSNQVYGTASLHPGSQITHSWVHSIEKSRWTDTFEYDGETLMLVATEFSEYGAGMPLDEGDVTIEDGTVNIKNIDREFEAIQWIHSTRVDYRISVDGDDNAFDMDSLPDKEPLELRPQ